MPPFVSSRISPICTILNPVLRMAGAVEKAGPLSNSGQRAPKANARHYGTWHRVSAKHLPAYLDEMTWRFNNCKNPFLFRDTMLKLIHSEKPRIQGTHEGRVTPSMPLSGGFCV